MLDDMRDDRLHFIALSGIKRHAKWLQSSARQIHEHVMILKSLPEWTTDAEATLIEAKTVLIETLVEVQEEINAMKAVAESRK